MTEMTPHIVLFVYSLAISIALIQLLRRSGLSRWWLLLTSLPVINAIALCIFAFVRWPSDRSRDDNDRGHKANEVQALIDAIGRAGVANAQRLRNANVAG
jgi:hypothetical protein